MAGLNKNKYNTSSAGNKEKEIKEKETRNNKKSDGFFLSDYPWEDYEK